MGHNIAMRDEGRGTASAADDTRKPHVAARRGVGQGHSKQALPVAGASGSGASHGHGSVHGRRKSALSGPERQLMVAIAGTGCILAVLTSSAAPTGHPTVDAVYRCILVLATTLAGSRARRWSLVVASGLMVIGSTTWMLVPPVTGFAVASILAWRNRRDRVLGALVGMLTGWAALNLVWPTASLATALLAAAGVVPLWVSGYRVARSKSRRRIRWGIAAMVALAAIGTGVTALVAVTQRQVLESAASETIAAARGMTGRSTDDSARRFARAASRFESAASTADAIWTLPARLVPVVSQNLAAVQTAAVAGGEVNRTAAEIAGSVDYDRLQLDTGGIDLGVLASFEAPVERAETVLASVDNRLGAIDSPWLVAPVRDKLGAFAEQTGPLRDGAEVAAMAVNRLPAMLGGSGERRYLMLLGNPAESRDIGGHIGTFAELRASDGVLDVARVVRPYEIFGPGATTPPNLDIRGIPAAMLEMNPTRFPQNWGASPDMAVVADVARQLYPQSIGGSPIDGVLYADPIAFNALLAVVGPIKLDASVSPATGAIEIDTFNAVEFLTREQFANDESGADPAKYLVETALDRLTGNKLPAISRFIDSFADAVGAGHLQFVTFHGDEGALLKRTGLDQRFAQPAGGDLLAVVNSNSFASKIDSYLERSIQYGISWNPESGAVNARVDVTLRNTAPATGLPLLIGRSPEGTVPGTNRTVLSVITPFDVAAVTLDGEQIPVGTRPEEGELHRHSVVVDLPPGAERVLRVNMKGHVEPGPDYRLRLYNQPLVNPDEHDVAIRSTGKPFVGGMTVGRVPLHDRRVEDLRIRTGGSLN